MGEENHIIVNEPISLGGMSEMEVANNELDEGIIRNFIGNEALSKEINKIASYFEEVSEENKDEVPRLLSVFVQDRITCKCGCHLYRVAYNCHQYIVTPAYLLMLANKGRIKNREYRIKKSENGREYVDIEYMKHIKSNWTFAQFNGKEKIKCTAFSDKPLKV